MRQLDGQRAVVLAGDQLEVAPAGRPARRRCGRRSRGRRCAPGRARRRRRRPPGRAGPRRAVAGNARPPARARPPSDPSSPYPPHHRRSLSRGGDLAAQHLGDLRGEHRALAQDAGLVAGEVDDRRRHPHPARAAVEVDRGRARRAARRPRRPSWRAGGRRCSRSTRPSARRHAAARGPPGAAASAASPCRASRRGPSSATGRAAAPGTARPARTPRPAPGRPPARSSPGRRWWSTTRRARYRHVRPAALGRQQRPDRRAEKASAPRP